MNFPSATALAAQLAALGAPVNRDPKTIMEPDFESDGLIEIVGSKAHVSVGEGYAVVVEEFENEKGDVLFQFYDSTDSLESLATQIIEVAAGRLTPQSA
jgi:hypothetical protein